MESIKTYKILDSHGVTREQLDRVCGPNTDFPIFFGVLWSLNHTEKDASVIIAGLEEVTQAIAASIMMQPDPVPSSGQIILAGLIDGLKRKSIDLGLGQVSEADLSRVASEMSLTVGSVLKGIFTAQGNIEGYLLSGIVDTIIPIPSYCKTLRNFVEQELVFVSNLQNKSLWGTFFHDIHGLNTGNRISLGNKLGICK